MKILILHRVPYGRIQYERGIDHDVNDVTYLGTKEALATLPSRLRHRAVARPGKRSAFEEALDWRDLRHSRFERVISLSEYELLDAAKLRELLGIQGPTLQDVQLVRDKVLMKHAVGTARIRIPRFARLRALLEKAETAQWTGQTVLKPHSGASSEDVVVFASLVDALRAVTTGSTGIPGLDEGTPALELYQVEEFISGDVLHFDGLVANGQVLTITASRYVGTCLGFASGEPLGSFHFPVSATTRQWVADVLAAVSTRNGSFHLEAIEAQAGLVFLEVGNRVGGADVVATFELATGVHLPSEELRILIGGEPTRELPPTQSSGAWHGWFVFPGHTSTESVYQGIEGIDTYRRDPGVVRWVELPEGHALQRKVTYSAGEAPLAGIVAFPDPAATQAWLRGLFSAARARSAYFNTTQD
ncbi:MAG TPA: carboxylate--amine ligase, partial [Paraburkholderia sp.]|nr:carboxylate--amine ligase [Paraburkholderia sp.]